MHGATKPASAPALVVVSLYVLAASACGPTPPPRADTMPASQQFDTLTATVRQIGESGLEVMTGVQLALKTYYVYVDQGTRVAARGRTVTLDDLEPGQVVRIRYHRNGERMVAEVIELVEVPGRGGEP